MRPIRIWAWFAVCAALLLAVMAWVTSRILDLNRANAEVQRRAAVEGTVRLALWRMDAAFAPVLIEESARPYFDYLAFNAASPGKGASLEDTVGTDLVPSPLLTRSSSNVVVYFNSVLTDKKTSGAFTSPQVPQGKLRDWAEKNLAAAQLMADNAMRLNTLASNVSANEINGALSDFEEFAVAMPPSEPDRQSRAQQDQPAQVAMSRQGEGGGSSQQRNDFLMAQQQAINADEYRARVSQKTKAQTEIQRGKLLQYDNIGKKFAADPAAAKKSAEISPRESARHGPLVVEGSMRPLWIGNLLLLARRVSADGRSYVQGAWLNWEHIRNELLAEVRDILPEADLVPASAPGTGDESRMMATLPARLAPGSPARLPLVAESPVRGPLAVAWCCVLVAVLSVGLLLGGSISLSERRGSFVSAVTHELRSPLTTFRMYTEMLSEGMVSPGKRASYIDTLRTESVRLSHLVENVLAYARLERGRALGRVEETAVTDALDRISDRLADRARQAGMTLVLEAASGADSERINVDVSALEQILFNLVDNACKYACASEDKRIHLAARCTGDRVVISVRDHGPGIGGSDRRRMFKPFSKSAKRAAETAPGVGLGLALSRRLAGQMGGRLALSAESGAGACFELTFPRV